MGVVVRRATLSGAEPRDWDERWVSRFGDCCTGQNLFLRAEAWATLPEDRRQLFLVSRGLLADVLSEVGSPAWGSLSHSRGELVAVGVLKSPEIVGVGVDLEFMDRVLSPGVVAKFRRSGDAASVPDLALWCIKEACFKAWAGNRGRVISDICVTEWDGEFGSAEVDSVDETGRFLFRCRVEEGAWVALAVALGAGVNPKNCSALV